MRALHVLFLASLLSACGGSDSPTPAAPITAADFPARANAAFCKSLSSCCQAASITYDPKACQEHQIVDQGKWNGILSLASITYSAEVAGACVAAIESSCLTTDDILDLPGCQGLVTGNVVAGQPCTIDPECAAPAGKQSDCYHPGDDGPGVCVVFTTDVPAGAACSAATGTVCAAGLFCDSTGHCTAGLASGSTCTFSDYCADGACSPTSQTCAPYAAVGQPCDPFCTDDAYCQIKDSSGHDAICASFPCPDGVCVARKAKGSACEQGDECAGNLRCVSGHCELRTLESCSDADDSATGSGK